jgi:hypothetical protein
VQTATSAIRGFGRALLLVAAVVVLAACASSAGPHPPAAGDVIDGFVLGPLEKCSSPIGIDPRFADRTCAGQEALATAALESREPGHARIESVRRFADGTQPGPIDVTGPATLPPLPSRHAGRAVEVFVFTLSDGTLRATGTACPESGPCVGVGSYPG